MKKIGVIGAGYWGSNLSRNFDALPGAQLTWVSDPRQNRLDYIKSSYPGVNTTRDYRQLLASDVDAVVVATPVVTHHSLSLEALRAGKHLLVEKPLAAGIAKAEEIVAEGDRQQRVVMVGHCYEYSPAVESMKSIIASGELGEIFCIHATRVNLGRFRSDVNVAWDLAVHDISILLFVLEMEPEVVCAHGHAYVYRDRQIHDVATITLYFPCSIMVDLRVSWLDPQKVRRVTVIGSKKMLVLDDARYDHQIMIYDKRVEVRTNPEMNGECELFYHDGGTRSDSVPWSEPLRIECQHFLDCIQNNDVPRSCGRVGLKVVKILEAVQRSLVTGGRKVRLTW